MVDQGTRCTHTADAIVPKNRAKQYRDHPVLFIPVVFDILEYRDIFRNKIPVFGYLEYRKLPEKYRNGSGATVFLKIAIVLFSKPVSIAEHGTYLLQAQNIIPLWYLILT